MRACSFTGIQHRDVIVFKENLRFHPSTPVHNGVFKDIHAGEGFIKKRVFGDRFQRIGVADRPNRSKNLRSKTNSETC